MAEAFLKVVLNNLGGLIKEEIGLIMGVEKEMMKLCSTLTTIQAVLEDAELKQTESRPIRDWLRKVNALAYEIDDILDECNTHVSKLHHSHSKLSRYGLKKILYRHKIGRRMKHVSERLDSVAAERAKFHLRELPVDRPREFVAAASRETGSLLNDSDKIVGRDEDRDKIVKMLVEDAREKQDIMTVLPVLGVGGLGKTSLAQLVYNDPRVVDCFDRRIWVCVSDNFEMKTLVKAMIESATGTGKASDLQHLDALQRRLWELLSQKRYLIVLDDVWNDHQDKWCELKDVVSCGSMGSSIIVTTRQKKVADIMGTLPPHCLEGLSHEHCWMLLRQRAFGHEEEKEYPELERIGKQIVKKCAGVPLAAKALGGILRFKRAEKEWIYVRESEMWKLSPEESLIIPALRLSYHHLPLELRHCFAYFAAFPKDYRIEKEELIHLWVAHGYISAKGTLQVEDVGNDICNELILRSLLQRTSYGLSSSEHYSIHMHDLVHDLAQSVMENKVPGTQIEKNITSAPSTIRQVNLLERCVYFPKSFQQDIVISSIMELRSVRVLDASDTAIKDLPSVICNLKHLRYLNMSRTKISTLPDSLCSLWNLQILNLDYCHCLEALPKNIRYMHNLQHLCLSECESLSEMPSKMRELTSLKTLSMFVVGLNKGNQLEELQCLNVGRRLEIRRLERVKGHIDAKKANLAEKKDLRKLSLSWKRYNISSKLEEDVDEKVFEALQPHSNLESLTIRGFRGSHFPLWMTDSALGRIVEVNMKNCRNCRHLPKLGELPCLKRLTLANVGVEYINEYEFGKGNPVMIQFLALEVLSLHYLPNLKGLSKDQENKEAFPNLKKLWIERCYSLTMTPISPLQKLEDLQCSSLTLALLSEQDTLTNLAVEIEENMICFPTVMLVKFPNLVLLMISGAQEISTPGGKGLQALKKLQRLALEDCKTMTCLPQGLLQHLTTLRSLSISWCPELVELPEEIKQLQNLVHIEFDGLAKMARLPEALQHLSSLTSLTLTRLPELESLPDWLHQLTDLSVMDCAKLVSLQALPNLKGLAVRECPQLERRCQRGSGEDWHKIAHIRQLRIELADLPEEIKHLENLEWVDLSYLPKMVWLPRALQHVPSLRTLSLCWLTELRSLSVSSCPKVVSIPPLPNLKELSVTGKAMPESKWRGVAQHFPHSRPPNW